MGTSVKGSGHPAPRIGFPLSLSGGGPSLFMRRLRASVRRQGLAGVSFFPDPFTDVNVCANVVRNPWGKPYVFRVDGIYFDRGRPPAENAARNRPIFEGIDGAAGLVFQSEFARRLVERFHRVPGTPSEVIGNGVDLEEFSPEGRDMRRKLGIAREETVFVTSAKWRAHKRLEEVAEVFREYERGSGRACHLLVLGKAEGRVAAGHPRVHLPGHVEPKDLPAWYRSGDIFLFFSWLDNCPSAVVEALACGLPVVCTDQGGTRELVERTRGGLVAEADRPFDFEPVDLYRPPSPDRRRLLEAVGRLAGRLDEFRAAIDRAPIDIDLVAKRYVAFIGAVARGERG